LKYGHCGEGSIKIKNADITKVLREIGFMLEMEEEESPNVIFKVRSYKAASDVIANLSSNIEEIYKNHGLKGLMQIPSIGKAIASKIEEYLKTGKIQYLEELKSKTSINVDEFYGLEGIGPKTIKIIYDNLGVKDLSDLEKAASKGKLRNIRGFSERKEEIILKKIQQFRKRDSQQLPGKYHTREQHTCRHLHGKICIRLLHGWDADFSVFPIPGQCGNGRTALVTSDKKG